MQSILGESFDVASLPRIQSREVDEPLPFADRHGELVPGRVFEVEPNRIPGNADAAIDADEVRER